MTATIVRPAYLWVPERVGSYGAEVSDLAKMAGRPLDPEQDLAVDAICSHRADGTWSALEAAVIEGRQNGKTGGIILPVVLADLFLFDADRIVWTAHLFKTARDAFNDVKQIIEGTPEFSRRVRKITEANGEEGVELMSGARLEFLARSKGGGRGLGGKRLVLDEALFLSAASMGALIPTLSARPNPQIVYGSSAGVADSDHLRNLRDRGRARDDPTLVYLEWGTPKGGCKAGEACTHAVGSDGCALDDESLWPLANPALGRRITVDFVRGERRALPPEEFARERLGWWDDPLAEQQPIDLMAFAALVKLRDKPAGPPVFCFDVSPGMKSTSIGVTASDGTTPHAELSDHRPGTGWFVARAAELQRRYPHARWCCEATAANGALLPELAERGIEPEQFGTPEMGRACAHLQKTVADKAITFGPDQALSVALAGAVKRDIGDGMWAWGRRRSSIDISPIVAVTGSAWGHAKYIEEPSADIF